MATQVGFPSECVNTALVEFRRLHPEPCHGDYASWALWYEVQRAAMLDAARRYDIDSLEYGDLFVIAHHAAKRACELRETYHRATDGGRRRLICRHGHVHGTLVPTARRRALVQPSGG